MDTAERLFYSEGIRAVGIDRIIAEAGVAKMSLYKHFASKDDLILAALQSREETFSRMFRKQMDGHLREGMDGLDAFFGALKTWFRSRVFRGCMFINAYAELADPSHQASQYATAHKRRFHKLITDILESTVATASPPVARAIALLVEGAIVAAMMHGSAQSADTARIAARSLLMTKPM